MRKGQVLALALAALAWAGATLADHAAFSGNFAGGEPAITALPCQCTGAGSLGYQVFGRFQVSAAVGH